MERRFDNSDYEEGYQRRNSSRFEGSRDGSQNNYRSNRDGNERSYRPRFNRNENDGENSYDRPRFNRNFNRDNNGGEERPRFNRSFNRDNNGGEERPRFNRSFNRDNNGGEERPRFNRSFNRDNNGGEERPRFNRSFNRDNNGGGERPRFNRGFNRDNNGGEERPRFNRSFNRDNNGGEERPRFNRSFNRDNNEDPRPRFNNRGYNNRNNSEDPRPRFNNNRENSFNDRRNSGYSESRPRFNKDGFRQNDIRDRQQSVISEELFVDADAANVEETQAITTLEKIRLNRYIAMSGVCSRREADELIKDGKVTVNGKVVCEMGVTVSKNDVVEFEGRTLHAERKVYVLLNKPKDTVTTTDDPEDRRTVMDLVSDACEERIYPIGRLDRNTTGLLILTNDGDLAEKLMHPRYGVRKIYHVFLDKNVTEEDMRKMADGLTLEDGPIAVDDVRYVEVGDRKQVGVQIHSGRNRIVRRIFEHLGYQVERLDRVYFAGLTKLNLPRGRWRYLTDTEINKLKAGFFK